MDLKNLFNSYVSHGLNAKLNGLNRIDDWNNKISTLDSSLNGISGEWVTTRIFYNGTSSSNRDEIYEYLYNRIGMKDERDSSDNLLPGFEQFYFVLQTAKIPKDSTCTFGKLAEIGYNVGQMLASIDFYSAHPLAIQYITSNKLNLVTSYISIPGGLNGGSILPVIDMYKKYINMTPYKGYKMVGGCSCGQPGCGKCDEQIIDLLI